LNNIANYKTTTQKQHCEQKNKTQIKKTKQKFKKNLLGEIK